MLDLGLDGKVALVTGGQHGIGAATARALATQGVLVFVTYLSFPLEGTGRSGHTRDGVGEAPGVDLYLRRRAMSADAVVGAIRERGGTAEGLEMDLSDPASIPLVFDSAEATLGPVDILVNNAAHYAADTFIPQPEGRAGEDAPEIFRLRTISADSHDAHFAVNSRATALLMAEYARRHIARSARWGRIVNVSSDGASAFPGSVSYGASKHALESYSRAAAVELGPLGVTVNVVSLGPIQTGSYSPQSEDYEAARSPLGRIGRPEDAADAIVLLVAEQARWITGQLIYVGGGKVMPL